MNKSLIIYLMVLPAIGFLASLSWENGLIAKTLWLSAFVYAIILTTKGE